MVKITTLIENNAGVRQDLRYEHGLSFWVERDGKGIVFDTGSGENFLYNAQKLGIDVTQAKTLVLSHGHFDHAGGTRAFYQHAGNKIPLLTGTNFFDEKYRDTGWGKNFLGTDFSPDWITGQNINHVILGKGDNATKEIIPGVWVVTDFPRVFAEEKNNPAFVVNRGGQWEIDDFRDEVCIVLDTRDSLVVIVGCSHPGIMNMLEAVKSRFNKKIKAVLGGIHLLEADKEQIDAFMQYTASIDCAGFAHCSGDEVVKRLQENTTRFYKNVSGSTLFL